MWADPNDGPFCGATLQNSVEFINHIDDTSAARLASTLGGQTSLATSAVASRDSVLERRRISPGVKVSGGSEKNRRNSTRA